MSIDALLSAARPRPDPLDRERVAAEVCSVLFGSRAELELGRFTVEARIGAGGMGIVYRGYDPELDRRVAIKVLDLRRVSGRPAIAHERLLAEARALARLTHPNVVTVHDVGLLDGPGDEPRLYLVMEYVDGPTLRRWMQDDHDLDARLALLLEAGRGLAAAHDTGLIHGDFKPDNILVGRDGRARVADFGLALPILDLDSGVSVDEPSVDAQHDSATATGCDLTLSGVFGTVAYIAPEQFLARRIDARADQFSFCVVACELLYGRRPFAGDSLESLAAAALSGALVELDDRRIPRSVGSLLRRGLASDPSQRFADMHELLACLTAAFAARSRRIRLLGSTVVVAGLGLAMAIAWPTPSANERRCPTAEQRLEAIWTHAGAGAIAVELRRDGLGPAAVEVAVSRLDEHARRWSRAWTQSCSIITDDATRERMQTCLDARLLELEGVVEALAEPERESIAPLAVLDQLAPVASCLEGASLDAARPVPPERARRLEVEQVRNQLIAQAELAAQLVRPDEALALAEQAVARARSLDYRPLEAEAQLALARALQSADRLPEAASMAERAHLSAEAGRHVFALADAAVLRVVLAGETAELEEGHTWLAKAEAANEAAGGDPHRAAQLRSAVCMLELMAGSYEAAVDQCERAQALIDRGARVGVLTRLQLAINFAIAEQNAGLLDRADRRFAVTEQAVRAELGPDHPWMINLLLNWGHVAYQRGDLDAALSRYLRTRERLDVERPSTAAGSIAVSIADVHCRRGDLREAEAEYKRAAEIAAALDDYWTAHVARSGLAQLALRRGDPRAALDAWSRQLADEQARLAPEHPWLLDLEVNIGAARALAGEVDDGLAQIDAVIARLEREHGAAHPEITDDLWVRGHVAHETGHFQQCVADLDRAHALELERSGPGSQVLAAIDTERTACRLALGDDPLELITKLEAVVEILAAGSVRADEGRARLELGRAYLLVGRREPARTQLERAEKLLRAEQGDHNAALATIAKLLEQLD